MDLNRIRFLAGLTESVQSPLKVLREDAEDGDPTEDELAEPKDEAPPKAEKAPTEKPKKDVPPIVAKFVTSGLAKKLVDAGLATDPKDDDGESLIHIVQPFYDGGFKDGAASKK